MIDFYGDALPSHGWVPVATQVEGRQAYAKSVAGKDVRYVVRADDEGVLVQIWTPYDVGLIGG